jgi:hypothetical protein
MNMHNPTRVASPRPDGTPLYFIVCSTCADQGRGRVAVIGDCFYTGVLHGPVSEQLAASLIDAHRETTIE